MPADGNFETKLGMLVDTQLSEKLPSLMDYRIGFQIIDKTEDSTRAVGVSGFIVKGQWIYIPTFFIDNDLKGMNLMYLLEKDIIVPALDNWIAAMNDEGTNLLGQVTTVEEENDPNYSAPADADVFVDGSISKTASAGLEKYASEDAEKYAFGPNSIIDKETWGNMCKQAAAQKIQNGPNLLQDLTDRLPKEAGEIFVDTFLNSPDFANSLFQFYTPDEIQKTARVILERKAHSEALSGQCPSKLSVISDVFSKEAAELKDSEKSVLMTNGVYVKDDRDNHSKVYRRDAKDHQLENPTRPGIYDILMSDGTFKTFAVLTPSQISQSAWGSETPKYSRDTKVAMVCISDPKKFFEQKLTKVFAKPSKDSFRVQFTRAEGGVKASPRSMKPLKPYTHVLISNGPGQSIRTMIRQNGAKVILSAGTNPMLDSDMGEAEVCFTENGKLSFHGGIIYIPSTARVFVIDYNTKHAFGTPKAVPTQLIMDNGLSEVKVHGGSGSYEVQSSKGTKSALSKEAAATHLCEDMGIYAGTAMEYLKDADRKGTASFFIKYAAGFNTGDPDENTWQGGPSGKDEQAITEESNRSKGKVHQNMLPEEAIQKAEQASQAGIKDVFDVKVLQPLLDKADVSELRRDYITDMVKAMDRLGRMLFLYYWHNDEFEAKYGKDELQELESTLEEVFHSMGDLVLFLKEKTMYNPDSNESLFGNMSEGLATADAGEEAAQQ